jgi:hypothetical protein
MALYLISYDIRAQNQDYKTLTDLLESFGALRILSSQWLLPNPDESAAKTIAETLSPHVISGDSLLVQEVTADAVWLDLRITSDHMKALLASARP